MFSFFYDIDHFVFPLNTVIFVLFLISLNKNGETFNSSEPETR